MIRLPSLLQFVRGGLTRFDRSQELTNAAHWFTRPSDQLSFKREYYLFVPHSDKSMNYLLW